MTKPSNPEQHSFRPRVTVLGGLGFIGSHLCRRLLAEGFDVRVFSKLYGSRELVSDIIDDLDVVEADIMQADEVSSALADSDYVFDLVHTTRPGSSMKDPVYDVTSNVAAHVQWLRRVADTRVRKFIYLSSGGTVYGPAKTKLIDELHPTNPLCSYGITKLAIEKYVGMYAELASIDWIVLRASNVYGPGNRLNVGQGVIGVLADRALNGQPLQIWGNGQSKRDYLHVDDLMNAMVAMLRYEGPEHVFNVSSGTGHTVLEIVDKLKEVFGTLPPIEYLEAREFDLDENVLDSRRLRNATGWEPRIDLTSGITSLVQWLKTSRAQP